MMADDNSKPRTKSEFNQYGCLLVGCSFILRLISNGISQSVGLIIRELIEEFHVGKSEANGIGSVNTGLMLLSGPLAGLVEHKLGIRVTVVLGSLISSVGLACSMFVPSFHVLYVTYGAITGFGFSLLSLSAMVPINMYFNERRTLANAFSNIGGGVGTSVFPFLIAWLMEEYGWRGLYLILAGISLQGVAVGLILKDNYRDPKKNALLLQKTDHKKEEQEKSTLQKIKDLYTNKYFVLYGIMSFSVDMVILVPFFMIPVISAAIGLSPRQQAMIITVAGIASIFLRPTIGLVVDRMKAHTVTVMGVAAIILGVSTLGLVYLQTYAAYLVYGCILGMTHGAYLLLKPIVLVDIVGKDSYALGLGFYRLFAGTAVITGPPLAGWIMDIRGHFDWLCYYALAVFTFGGCGLIIFNFFLKRRHTERYEKEYIVVSQVDITAKPTSVSLTTEGTAKTSLETEKPSNTAL
ncbi:monocarboxylate transporter 14-like [Mizuhopecten yessoensis]|uniref:Glutaredoxin-C4 n=1 Tax=Mizuhopecten yessoensis TaxID=6573 RepID=A0A210Q315_MIZYE|nr:monocarboxylate transporter 14-like [Mizuhopecten yessoensis]OWF43105.1 Glutaredoxin-C4 [Mizuhopecten yessoensis]